MSIYNFHVTKNKNPFKRSFQSAKLFTYIHLNDIEKDFTSNIKNNISSNNNNIGNNISETKPLKSQKYRIKQSHSHCFQETTNKIDLFLMQDDRGSIEEMHNNPLLEIYTHKEPLPNFNFKKKRNSKFFNKISNVKCNVEKNVVDINKLLIHHLNQEMEIMNSKRSFSFNDKNNIIKDSKRLNKSKEIKEKRIEKICKISPLIFDKLKKTKKNLPFLFKNIQNSIEKNEKKKTKIINLKEIVIMHNSNIRKSVSQFKVKNQSFRKSLKLKNRPIYSTYRERYHPLKTNSNCNDYSTNINDVYI